MTTLFKISLLAATFASGTLVLAGNPNAGERKPAAAPAVESPPQAAPGFSVEMRRGEVLQVIASEAREGGQDAARTYGRTAFPIASSFGFQRLGQLNVTRSVISDFAPEVFSFFSWPDQASADDFAAHPDWPAIKATRPDAWSELKVYSIALQDDLSLQFDPAKHYTVVVAWLNEENPADYDRYLTGIEPAVTRAGGRFMYKMRGPSMESHASPPSAPSQLTFVEWDSPDGFSAVQQSPEYLAHQQYFGTSVERFEFYWMQTPQSAGS